MICCDSSAFGCSLTLCRPNGRFQHGCCSTASFLIALCYGKCTRGSCMGIMVLEKNVLGGSGHWRAVSITKHEHGGLDIVVLWLLE